MHGTLDVGGILLDVLVVLVAAKVAAEVAERAGVPAVVGEIAAGILVGPSVLGLVADDAVLQVLGQLGVVLLLLEVGLQLDLAELGAVGRAAVLVALVGVAAPFVGGVAVATALGEPAEVALFLGAALTATSVGISARVFGDLGALAGVEARIVLGAAVVDDVLGLVVLTVVARLVTEGSVSLASVAGVLGLAVAFLAVMGTVGVRLAPPLFRLVKRLARSPGTMVALALAFTLGVASLAQAARLAPIVGAFVAGLALARTDQGERIRRELTPVGHLLVPVFFLEVGINVRLGELADPQVIGLAAVLAAVAVAGKLAAAAGAIGTPGDKLLVGLGMLPRGEVGLIFAGLGLRAGVLDARLYATLLLTILATDLVAPGLLRWRLRRVQPEARPAEVGEGEANLAAVLEAATAGAGPAAAPELLDRLSHLGRGAPVVWDDSATEAFLGLLARGNERSWRLLEATGVLERALPELAAPTHRQAADPFELDLRRVLRWRLVDRVRELDTSGLAHPEWLLLAALLVEATGGEGPVARRLVRRLGLGNEAEHEIALLVSESGLLRAHAARPEALEEEAVLDLACRTGGSETAHALYLLNLALADPGPEERARLDELHDRLQAVLARPELTSRAAAALVDQRRATALERLGDTSASRWIESAPRAYLLDHDAGTLARHAGLLQILRHGRPVAASVVPVGWRRWRIEVAHNDRRACLLGATTALAGSGCLVHEATAATWLTGAVVESLLVEGDQPPSPALVEAAVLAGPGPAAGLPVEGRVRIGRDASPWHTVVEVSAPNRLGLLHDLAAALVRAGVVVRSARLASPDGLATASFRVVDHNGRRLDEQAEAAVASAMRGPRPTT